MLIVGADDGMEHAVRPHIYIEREWPGLDVGRYRTALNAAITWHCDSVVAVTPELSLRKVVELTALDVPVHDLRGCTPARLEKRLEYIRDDILGTPLPFDHWPWLNVQASRYGDGQVRLHVNFSNFFLDLVSANALLAHAETLYHDPEAALPPVRASIRDLTLTLEQRADSPRGERSRTYWQSRLDTLPEPPALPATQARSHTAPSRLTRRRSGLDANAWGAFKQTVAALGLTPTAGLMAVCAEVVSRWSGSRHFILNNMISRRMPPAPGFAEALGNLSSVYPLEFDWRGEKTLAERASGLQKRLARDLAHTLWGGADVLQALSARRRTQGRAVCPFVIAGGLGAGPQKEVGFSLLETPQTLVDHQFWEMEDGSLTVVWDVHESAFPEGFTDDLCAAYDILLAALATDPRQWRERHFALVPERDRRRREELAEYGDVPSGLLHDGLGRAATGTPDRTAVVASDGELTYAQLYDAANTLAGRLHEVGLRPGDRVLVAQPKSAAQIKAVHGVLAAGGVYVPLDPAWPFDRVRTLAADCHARIAVADPAVASRFELAGVQWVVPDGPGHAPTATRPAAPPRDPRDLAYVIYTSGSTGTPKGVALDHRGPLNTITDINRRFGIGPQDVLFGISALSFDLSVYDVFGAAAAGAALVLPDPSEPTPDSWLKLLADHQVTVWNSAPQVMQLLVQAALASGVTLPRLRRVLLSGDWIPVTLPDEIRRVAPNAGVVSLGGATEASIWSIHHPIGAVEPHWVSIPYGRPLTNQPWYILDELGQETPTWVTGHLHIGGVGLAVEYLGSPEKTAAAFVPHSASGERIYRAGDLGRYLPDGTIELLGRADLQVKIQGYRIEPGEIEHALLADERLRDAAVIAVDGAHGKQLAAFVVPREGAAAPDPEQLRGALTRCLPGYMVPHQIGVLDAMPVTSNGKLDRAGLAGKVARETSHRTAFTPPRTTMETTLAAIWESVLGAGRVGAHDDFFDLGGHSFAALVMITRIRQETGRDATVGLLLEHRTVAGLAGALEASSARPSCLVPLNTSRTGTPYFLVHPAGGNVYCYGTFAARLPHPAFGLQFPDATDPRTWPSSVEELADLYLAEIKQARPHGPYILAGWSSGAPIAFEAARRLEQDGERVERVVVIDAPAPHPAEPVDDMTLLLWFVEDLGTGFDAASCSPGLLAGLRSLSTDEQRLERLLAGPMGTVPPALDRPALLALLAVFRQVVRAVRRYRPTAIEADIEVYRAEDGQVSEFTGHPAHGSLAWGWDALTRGTARSTWLPATHYTAIQALTDRLH